MAQIGIASMVMPDGRRPKKVGKPGQSFCISSDPISVYTSVADYKGWIKSIAPEALDTNCK